MKTNYVELHQHLEERLALLGTQIPGPVNGFAPLHNKAVEDGALAIGIVVGCGGCIAYQVHDAVAGGATRQELLETGGVTAGRRAVRRKKNLGRYLFLLEAAGRWHDSTE